VHYPPIHRFSAYEAIGSSRRLATTDAVAGRLVTLPLYPHLTDENVETVTSAVLDAASVF
jgi:dTDP-4-amino-4,6-dideoxygalactose transaminase